MKHPRRPLVPIPLFALPLIAASCIEAGGGGGGGGGTPPADSGALLPSVGLTSAAAGAGTAAVAWVAEDADGNPVPIAIFGAPSVANVYAGAPLAVGPPGTSMSFPGLPVGQPFHFGLALDQGGGSFAPVGAVLRVVPSAPIYVDAASTAATPDGTSPATAFPTLIAGVLTAFAAGGGNVWVAGGTYTDVAVPVHPDVAVYGGFDGAFDLDTRDPAAFPTVLQGQPGTAVVEILGGGSGGVLDGVVVDGGGASTFGVDVDSTPAQLSSLTITDCAGRGVRLRSALTNQTVDVIVARSVVAAHGAEGLSLDGAFHLTVEGSRFSANANEGVDLDALVAPEGVPVSLTVRDSIFFGNGAEGLDCDLAPPLVTGPMGGRFDVEVVGSRFERNGWAAAGVPPSGLKIDIDFEFVPGWEAGIEVRGCVARANRGPGAHLDLDWDATTRLHRVLATGNGGDGVLLSSESDEGLATISSSVFAGNQGHGLRATFGNVRAIASHCVFAGNGVGGMTSDTVESLASSSIAWLQPAPWTGVRQHFDLVATDPLMPVFDNAPVEYRTVQSFDGTQLTLDDASNLVVGDPVEIAADGTDRSVAALGGGNSVEVTPNADDIDLPSLFTRFAPGMPVAEDYALSVGSAGQGSGMPPPVGAAPDGGPFGAPFGGEVGRDEVSPPGLLWVRDAQPGAATALGSTDDLVVSFEGGTLDSLTIGANTVRVLDGVGSPVPVTTFFSAGDLVVRPTGAWPTGDLTLELHIGLEATDGTPLATPVALPWTAP